ncbi:protein jag [Desulfovibrio litoralis]|uniref:RNA-binding protein KhpB n=1 Tax=Desulfovibrio litoralis DSM 11393 TaxID=1121455 RepID=A0A1M7RTH2_9BACT|nr:protein jag [Desulfovibrio litoralis]SHN49388.1 spoIIIJ-associated protein [Desulfovibrio litoralis DSM 11393]
MSNYTEFQGKTLDLAINAACTFFDVSRDKLEIEIVNDAKSGIFGLVGVKKATIRAKRMSDTSSVLDSINEQLESPVNTKTRDTGNEKRDFDKKKGRREIGSGERQTKQRPHNDFAKPNNDVAKPNKLKDKSENGGRWAYLNENQKDDEASNNVVANENVEAQPQKRERNQRLNKNRPERPQRKERVTRHNNQGKEFEPSKPQSGNNESEGTELYSEDTLVEDNAREGFAFLNVEEVGVDKVIEETRIVVSRLVDCIVEDYSIDIEIIEENKIKVMIDAGESSGLLIGRYSQTLTAIQYMAARILTRVFNATTRIQIDAGDYRERQDEKMRELALSLAQRVKEEGRGLYTRPLSSYHRRVVHMVLQDDTELQTRSKGEGSMKRILILPKRRQPKEQ